ncbi:MAG TPA: RnfH family protein [Leucothrix sp.]|nr:RnfH family protein [Leucothrix sp.]
MGNSPDKIDVEVAYALPDEQILLVIQVQKGAEIKEVITQSKILEDYPELELDKLDVGIFGKMVKINQKVRDRDRIEIYRPLIADPKEVRKRRAAEGKRLKKGGATTASAK